MKFDHEKLTAAGFIFEKENGNTLSEFELEAILESNIESIEAEKLEEIIHDGLNQNLYPEIDLRISAYWALSKRFNQKLLQSFRNWLKFEFENGNTDAFFQLMIAIDKLDEPIFHGKRTSRSFDENEMNIRDVKEYLKNLNAI